MRVSPATTPRPSCPLCPPKRAPSRCSPWLPSSAPAPSASVIPCCRSSRRSSAPPPGRPRARHGLRRGLWRAADVLRSRGRPLWQVPRGQRRHLRLRAGQRGRRHGPVARYAGAVPGLSGAAGAGIVPLSMAWIGDTVPYERRQTLARFLTGTILGMSAGQLAGGLFADTVGWRWAFAALVCGYLIVGLLLRQEVRRQQAAWARAWPPARQGFVAQARLVLGAPWPRVVLATVFIEGLLVFGALAFAPSSARALRYFADRRRRWWRSMRGRIAIHRGGRSHPQAARRARTGGGGRAGAGRGLPVLCWGRPGCGACRRACWRASAITCCTLPCRPMPPRWCRPRAARQWPGSRPACSWGRPPAWRWPARWWTRSGRPRCSAVRP